jgi:Asp-tRNA(Asn)/Glu-tRNA(Gln) amidotransferase B subunit
VNDRIYGIIAGNVTKKELDLKNIIEETFTQRKLSQVIDLVISSKLSLINAKEIAYRIIDGEQRDPLAIAEAENLLEQQSD